MLSYEEFKWNRNSVFFFFFFFFFLLFCGLCFKGQPVCTVVTLPFILNNRVNTGRLDVISHYRTLSVDSLA